MKKIKHEALEPKSKSLDSLRADWQILIENHDLSSKASEQSYASAKAEMQIRFDRDRASLLAKYEAEGLFQPEMAKAIGLERSFVGRLLQYHRFVAFAEAVSADTAITERRFRAYWKAQDIKGLRWHGSARNPVQAAAAKAAFEAERQEQEDVAFRRILDMIQAGEEPASEPKASAARRPRPAQMSEEDRQFQTIVRKEVNRIYRQTIYPDLKALEKLMTKQGTLEWAPRFVAAHAKRVRQGMDQLESFLKSKRILD